MNSKTKQTIRWKTWLKSSDRKYERRARTKKPAGLPTGFLNQKIAIYLNKVSPLRPCFSKMSRKRFSASTWI